jgi:hypothetical protein
MKKIFRTITSVPQYLHRSFVTPFLPKYDVVFIMYSVVPGQPLSKYETVYNFEKGETDKAKQFYEKMILSTQDFKMMPSEVVMKTKNKIVKATQFGPVKEIQATIAA